MKEYDMIVELCGNRYLDIIDKITLITIDKKIIESFESFEILIFKDGSLFRRITGFESFEKANDAIFSLDSKYIIDFNDKKISNK